MSEDRRRGFDVINRAFINNYPADAGHAIDELTKEDAAELLVRQDTDAIVNVWRHISPARTAEIVELLGDAKLGRILQRLDPGVCAATLRQSSGEQVTRCLGLLPDATAKEIERLMEYPPDTAGRIMDARVRMFRPDDTVAAVLTSLRATKPRGIRQMMLVNDDQALVSVVDIQDLAVAEPDKLLVEIARPPLATVSPFDSREEVAERMRELSLDLLPVVDVNGRLMGIIRHTALVRTLREETSLDIQRMVGVSKDERALSSPWFAVKKRLPWMEINLATAFLAAAVVGIFEDTIAQFTALAVLLPVVAGQSGNAGAQALAVTMRDLALREITGRHWFRVMFKEAWVGAANGIAIALTTALGVYLWSGSSGLALVISISMVLSMIAAGISGSLVPIILTRLGQDPAQSSSIILTTVTDVAGFMSFLGIATLLSNLL
jgi:magnesium transporter